MPTLRNVENGLFDFLKATVKWIFKKHKAIVHFYN